MCLLMVMMPFLSYSQANHWYFPPDIVKEKLQEQNSIDMKALPSGIYIYNITVDGIEHHGKILKN